MSVNAKRRVTALAASMKTTWPAIALLATVCAGPARAQDHPENDPEFCSKLWKEVGLPSATAAVKTSTVCHLGYITGHNNRTKTPNWVLERLTVAETGTDDDENASREGKDFAADDKLPEKAQAKPADYEGSGFDQGHNAPAADFAAKQNFLDDTFFLSNSVPQVGIGFNRSIWRSLENQVRDLVGGNRPAIYVITGPVYQQAKPIKVRNDVCGTELELPVIKPAAICPETNENSNAKCASGVAVPAAMYKIVYDPRMQNAFAVLMANEPHTGRYKSGKGRDYIQAHRVGIATVEELTGLRFFSALPARKQKQMRRSCVDVRVH